MKYFLFIFIFIYSFGNAQEKVSGNVLSEYDYKLQNVTVINITTHEQAVTDNTGFFTIKAKVNDELRFLKENYERGSKKIVNQDFFTGMSFILVQMPKDINEVKIGTKITGDLDNDIGKIKTNHSKELLKKNVGLPQPKGVQREKAPIAKKMILPLLLGSLNVDDAYKLVSGKARKMKSLYQYEDMQANIAWIIDNDGEQYVIQRGIPKERINECLMFSILIKPQIKEHIKVNNISAVNLILEDTIDIYLKRLKSIKMHRKN
jgi:hypothetical protein